MAVTQKDVEHIAALAMLKFSDAEKDRFMHQLNHILEYMEKLNSLDTSKVEPLSHVIELKNVPNKYIHNPNEMTLEQQKEYGVFIGTDYPFPIVEHSTIKEIVLNKFKSITK